ncbi:SWIM zinc finger family protein, partial [Escherichia coli]|nr:SWIM zinc finger family protein [Escherichia coli]
SLHVVNLDGKKCTCRRFEREKLPCVHVIVAAEYRDVCRIFMCSHYYHKNYLVNAYAESIMPVDSALQVPDNVANQACFPPVVR